MLSQDEVIEERIWRGRVEIVSRVNWTQIARVRSVLGVTDEVLTGAWLAISPTVSRTAPLGIGPRRRGRRRRSRAA